MGNSNSGMENSGESASAAAERRRQAAYEQEVLELEEPPSDAAERRWLTDKAEAAKNTPASSTRVGGPNITSPDVGGRRKKTKHKKRGKKKSSRKLKKKSRRKMKKRLKRVKFA